MRKSFRLQKIKIVTVLLTSFLFLFFSGCDDSGSASPNNNLTFNVSGLGQLNTSTDGMYEAWVYFGDPYNYYISCGKFNVDGSGNVVDVNGNAKTLKLEWRPYDFNTAKYSLITVDPPSFTDTVTLNGAVKILGGDAAISGDTLTSVMSMSYPKALGSIVNSFSASAASFMLYTPTDTTTGMPRWFNGIWFCGTDTVSSIMNLPVLPDSLLWIYQAWIFNGYDPNHAFTKIGFFKNPYLADDDGAGSYAGPGLPFPRPGEDWIYNGPISDLRTPNYAVLISLEPVNGNYPTGFSKHFLQLFFGATAGTTSGQLKTIPNTAANLPTATMKIGNLTQ